MNLKSEKMKIVTLCGYGLGTSFALKYTVLRAASELGLSVDVIPSSIGDCDVDDADLYLVPYGMRYDPLKETGRTEFVRNVISTDEIKEILRRNAAHV